MLGVGRIGAAEDVAGAHDTQIRHGDEYLVRRADHDHVSAVEAQPVKTVSQPAHPLQELAGRQAFAGVLAIEP